MSGSTLGLALAALGALMLTVGAAALGIKHRRSRRR